MSLAFAGKPVRMAVVFVRELGRVPDEETGVAGELIRGLRNDLNELLGDDL